LTRRELLLLVINRKIEFIPSWTMGFFNVETARKLLGEKNVPDDIEPEAAYKFGPTSLENREKNIRYAEILDNFAIGVGKGGNFSFGHGGPGEFRERLIEKGEDYIITEHETGIKKRVNSNPYFYYYFDYPLMDLDCLDCLILPDAGDPGRYEGIQDDVEFYKSRGFFTYANLNGFFSAMHYFFYPYDKLFEDMLLNRKGVISLANLIGNFNLEVAENLLKCGVDCITFCEDLGSGQGLLFNPKFYEEIFWPWHKKLADLCHSYNAFLHMHSHGNIMKIFPKIVEAGIDMINPLDPYEGMDLRLLKREYGRKIVLVGGMHKFFFSWSKEEMERYFISTINSMRGNSAYIWMDNGGIPEDITVDKFQFYLSISKKYRYSEF